MSTQAYNQNVPGKSLFSHQDLSAGFGPGPGNVSQIPLVLRYHSAIQDGKNTQKAHSRISASQTVTYTNVKTLLHLLHVDCSFTLTSTFHRDLRFCIRSRCGWIIWRSAVSSERHNSSISYKQRTAAMINKYCNSEDTMQTGLFCFHSHLACESLCEKAPTKSQGQAHFSDKWNAMLTSKCFRYIPPQCLVFPDTVSLWQPPDWHLVKTQVRILVSELQCPTRRRPQVIGKLDTVPTGNMQIKHNVSWQTTYIRGERLVRKGLCIIWTGKKVNRKN